MDTVNATATHRLKQFPSINTWLKLGRVSNLPTVWANVLVGIALASSATVSVTSSFVLLTLFGISLAYIAGMFLNDVFDAEFDKQHRNDRPIAQGDIRIQTVATVAVILLMACVASIGFATQLAGQSVVQALCALLALLGCIVLYNAWHKNNPLSPVIMGACRALVYVTAALVANVVLSLDVLMVAGILWLYVIGLTYTAKQEHLNELRSLWPVVVLCAPIAWGVYTSIEQPMVMIPLVLLMASVMFAATKLIHRSPGDVPKAVVSLIAAMALVDAMVLFAFGFPALALMAMGCWVLTLAAQRWVSGT